MAQLPCGGGSVAVAPPPRASLLHLLLEPLSPQRHLGFPLALGDLSKKLGYRVSGVGARLGTQQRDSRLRTCSTVSSSNPLASASLRPVNASIVFTSATSYCVIRDKAWPVRPALRPHKR